MAPFFFSIGKPPFFPCPLIHHSWRQQYWWTTASKWYLPKSGSDTENPLLRRKRQKRSREKVMLMNRQIPGAILLAGAWPRRHPDGRYLPGPDVVILMASIWSRWYFQASLSSETLAALFWLSLPHSKWMYPSPWTASNSLPTYLTNSPPRLPRPASIEPTTIC